MSSQGFAISPRSSWHHPLRRPKHRPRSPHYQRDLESSGFGDGWGTDGNWMGHVDIELLVKRSVLYWCWFYSGCWHLWIYVSVVDSCWQGNALWIINLPWYKKLPRLLLVMTQIQWQDSCWFGFVFSRSFRKQRQYDNTCCAPRAIRVQPDPKPCANWVLFLWFLCTGPPVTPGQKSKRFVLPGDPKHHVWHLQIWIILNYHILSVFAQEGVQQTKPLLMDFGFEKSLNSSQLLSVEVGSLLWFHVHGRKLWNCPLTSPWCSMMYHLLKMARTLAMTT